MSCQLFRAQTDPRQTTQYKGHKSQKPLFEKRVSTGGYKLENKLHIVNEGTGELFATF
jgi:hypothetical protein